jgi:hypothetical protein
MPACVIADVQGTGTAAYEPYRPLAAASILRFGGRSWSAAGRSRCSRVSRGRNGSSSSNSRTRRPALLVPFRTISACPEDPTGRLSRTVVPGGRSRLAVIRGVLIVG